MLESGHSALGAERQELMPAVAALRDWAGRRGARAGGHLRKDWRRFRAEQLPGRPRGASVEVEVDPDRRVVGADVALLLEFREHLPALRAHTRPHRAALDAA